MGRAKFVAIAAFACLTAAIVLAAILCTKSDVRAHFTGPSEDSPPSDELSPPFNERSPSSDQLSPPAPKGSAVGVLTHRDAHHLEGGSPFFARQSVSGRLQPSLAYFEHVMGRQLEGEERRRLASTQQVPINGTLRGSQASYYVTLQLGTPPQNVTLLLDSGSALFWTECNDCPDCTGLYNVSAFLASESTSLTLPGCDQCPTFQYGLCAGSNARPSTKDNCFSVCSKTRRECFYGYTYGDLTQSKGYIQRDVLSIPSRDGPPLTATVTFGCNKAEQGPETSLFASPLIFSPDVSGILGLSKGNMSVLSQLANAGAAANKFAHCLAGVEGGGLFTLGADTRSVPGIAATKMGSHREFYNATIKSITVGNDTLPIPASVFYAKQPFSYYTSDPLFVPDAIFDSGTPFSILPEAAYAALSAKVFTSNVTLTSPETAFNVTGPPSAFERSGTYEPLLSIVKYKAVTYSSSGYVSEYPTPAPTSAYLAPPPSSYSSYSKLLCFVIPPREVDDAGGFNTSSFPNIAIAFEGATLTVRPTEYLFVFQAKDGLGISVTTIACPAFRSDQGQGLTIIGEYSMLNQYMIFDRQSGLIGMAPVNCTTLM